MSDIVTDFSTDETPLKTGDRCCVFKKDGSYLIRYFAYSIDGSYYFAANRTDAVGHRSDSISIKPTQKWNKFQKV